MSDVDVDFDMNDLAALRKAAPRKTGGNTVKSRAKAEKHVKPTDGRRNRVSHREPQEPLNVDVAPHVKQMVMQARTNWGMPMKAFVADAIEHYFRHLELQEQSESAQ
jgi:ribosome-binding protein aMBF1 (putative translation factor)